MFTQEWRRVKPHRAISYLTSDDALDFAIVLCKLRACQYIMIARHVDGVDQYYVGTPDECRTHVATCDLPKEWVS